MSHSMNLPLDFTTFLTTFNTRHYDNVVCQNCNDIIVQKKTRQCRDSNLTQDGI